MPAEAYHADPVPGGSLSSTGARLLVQECPAAYQHARQNQERKPAFDIGTATHLLVLEPDLFASRIATIPFDDYKKGEARAARDQAYADGVTPLTLPELGLVRAMRDSLWANPVARFAFGGGQAELAMFWRDPEFGVWCRTRPDYLPPHGRYLVDLKTSTSANPRHFEKQVAEYGYHQQAAWYLDGFAACTGQEVDRFAFVVVSKKPPHLVSTCWMDPEALHWGRVLNRRAMSLFARCQATGEWPSYQPDPTGKAAAFTVGLPSWASRDLQRRFDAGELEPLTMEAAQAAAA